MLKIIKSILLTTLLLTSSAFALSDKELAISIDLSGKQRMLSQKMTKEAFLIRSKIDTELNLKKLTASSALFDKTLKGLMHGETSLHLVPTEKKEIQKQLQVVEKLWKPFYQKIQNILDQKASDSDYQYLESNNIKLLKEMNKAVFLYASTDKSNNSLTLANDINLAGKQRMLTQKMAKDILFVSNNFKKEEYLGDFKKSRALFDKTLKGLYNGSQELNLKGTKLPMITEKLDVVKSMWQKEQNLLDAALKGEQIKETISSLDKTLVKMNEAVISYTRSLNRQKQALELNSIVGDFLNRNQQDKKRVNLSGKQRMLTQRISKLSLLVEMNIALKENSKKLVKFAKLYNQTLNGFTDGDKELGLSPSKIAAIVEQSATIKKKWKTFLANIITIVQGQDKSRKALEYIVNNNEDLLAASNELVTRFVKTAPTPNYLEKSMLHVINVAGRQRMLTQKMTKEKLLIVTNKKPEPQKLQKTIALFDNSLHALIKGDAAQMILKPSDKKIKAQLQKVSKIWSTLKPLYEKEKLSRAELATIVKENPTLLKEMNKMVNMAEGTLEY
jgi:hypothetical protein